MAEICVSASRQLVLMSTFMHGIGTIRYRLYAARGNLLVKEFQELMSSFGFHGQQLYSSPTLMDRIEHQLAKESVFVVLSSEQDNARLNGEWNELIAGIVGQLRDWEISPFIIATYEHKLKLFAKRNTEFRQKLIKQSLEIGPIVLRDVGAYVAERSFELAFETLNMLLLVIEASVHDLLINKYTPVT